MSRPVCGGVRGEGAGLAVNLVGEEPVRVYLFTVGVMAGTWRPSAVAGQRAVRGTAVLDRVTERSRDRGRVCHQQVDGAPRRLPITVVKRSAAALAPVVCLAAGLGAAVAVEPR